MTFLVYRSSVEKAKDLARRNNKFFARVLTR